MSRVIRTVDDIGLEWLNAMIPDAGIRSFRVDSTSEEFCSVIAKVRLWQSGNAQTSSIFFKLAKLGKDGIPTGSGLREVIFYNSLSGTVLPTSIPRCYFAAFEEDSGYYTIVLEDLSASHDQEAWPNEAISEQFGLAAECLAGIHACWWNRQDARSRLRLTQSESDRKLALQLTKEAASDFITNYSATIAEPLLKTFRECQTLYDQVLQKSRSLCNFSVIHGDSHFWNFLYPKHQKGSVYLIDWDSYDVDMPTHDLAKYFAVIWSQERRTLYERGFLQRYHEKLVALGVRDYPFEDLLFEYKISILLMLYLPVKKEGWGLPKDIWLEEFENILSAIADLNCLDAGRELCTRL